MCDLDDSCVAADGDEGFAVGRDGEEPGFGVRRAFEGAFECGLGSFLIGGFLLKIQDTQLCGLGLR